MNTIISFSCPIYLAQQLNESGIPRRQKSKFIADALTEKLNKINSYEEPKLSEMTSFQIICALKAREDIDEHLREELQRRIKQEYEGRLND